MQSAMLKFTSSTHYIHNVKKVSSQFKYKNIMLCDNRRTIEFENPLETCCQMPKKIKLCEYYR